MKRKMSAVTATMCAVICAFGLAACGGGGSPAKIWNLYATDGVQNDYNGLTRYVIDTEYGANVDLSTYKLFLTYSDAKTEEVARDSEKLAVKYYYSATYADEERQEITALPDDKIKGGYTIEYTYDGNPEWKAEVYISVGQSQSGAFTVQPVGGTTWQSQGKPRQVVVKNPKGGAVKQDRRDDGSVKPAEKTDDTDGRYDLYLFDKSVYDGFTEAQKKDKDFLYGYFSDDNASVSEHKVYAYYPEFNEVVGVPAGEYMLLALVEETYNYCNIATPAVHITVV